MPSDTDPKAHRAQVEAWRRLGPEGRLRTAIGMSEDARRISLEGIRRRYPQASESTVQLELARLLYGDELALRAWGERSR
ncbi:MAG TPA: hypothetical protein VF407_13350 [Polyangiaceae bacterium]